MREGGPALGADQLDRLCTSLAVNPSWEAAADYAGVSSRSLRTYRTYAEQYENAMNGDETVADLTAQRLYRNAAVAWASPERRSEALALLVRLDDYLEHTPKRRYYVAVQRMMAARSRCEMRLSSVVYEIATSTSARDADKLKAAWLLLKSGWPLRYSDRLEVTGASGGPVEVAAIADAEVRAVQALERWEATTQHASANGDAANASNGSG